MNHISSKLISAAAGRRDDYQVPIALAEAGLLASHVTDVYMPDALVPVLRQLGARGSRLLRRHSPQLRSRLVHPSARLVVLKAIASLIPSLKNRLMGDQDPISWTALAQARRHHAGLLLYAGYAYRAFTAESHSARRRGLIQYHPHIRDSAAILRADAKRHPFIRTALEQLRHDEQDYTNSPELEIADLVICNSTFTAATCRSLGIEGSKLLVIPYGIDPIPPSGATPNELIPKDSSVCQFLFVGSGIQRKGLHHLLLAWKQAGLKHSRLTIVSRWIDPEIRSAIDPGEGVRWLDSVNNQQLDRLYQQSDVFVMPSLIEGFGYVYLEAMARGCFCIGTANTGLPDVATPGSSAVVPAGDLEQLADALQVTEQRRHEGEFDRAAIASAGAARNWCDFRANVVSAVQSYLMT
ncbi:glycosyltransferase family 4 protein [Vulcanococcus limneticus]|uniref:glycosyltransferase family 4 protein n=1 Tax=Vulcanococcus limneticus TaxID=2170428 RepID=UPI00398BD4FB